MTCLEEVTALCVTLGLSTDYDEKQTAPIGNGTTQSQTIESHAGRLTRRLEEHLGLIPQGQLGVRVRAIKTILSSPLGKAVKSKARIILFTGHYSPALCRLHPDLLFVFGDNTIREGCGGQAAIRREPNAVGVATKCLPSSNPDAFFKDGYPADMGVVCEDLMRLEMKIKDGKRVVLPMTPEGRISLGCGLANLPYHAPLIYMMIERWFGRMTKMYPSTGA